MFGIYNWTKVTAVGGASSGGCYEECVGELLGVGSASGLPPPGGTNVIE